MTRLCTSRERVCGGSAPRPERGHPTAFARDNERPAWAKPVKSPEALHAAFPMASPYASVEAIRFNSDAGYSARDVPRCGLLGTPCANLSEVDDRRDARSGCKTLPRAHVDGLYRYHGETVGASHDRERARNILSGVNPSLLGTVNGRGPRINYAAWRYQNRPVGTASACNIAGVPIRPTSPAWSSSDGFQFPDWR